MPDKQNLSDEQVAQFQRDGFLNAGPVLDEPAVRELSDELDRVIAIGPDGFAAGEPQPVQFRNLGGTDAAPVVQIVNIWEAAPAFERLIYHPLIVRAIGRLTGFGDLQVWHDQVQYKPSHTGGCTPWHQDAPLWPSITPMTPVSAWIPFDDAEVENGCMWMVPGSHRWGNQMTFLEPCRALHRLEDFQRIAEFGLPDGCDAARLEPRPCPVRRGEVHFHHSLTWHGSPENHSTRPRRALAIHYMTSEAQFTGRNHPMRPFIEVEVGGRMLEAGPHFPIVARGGEPVAPPTRVPVG